MPDVVLVEPEIPQNTGNIGRTCVATGSKLWLVRPLGFRLEDRLLRRAGLDYWQHLDVEVVDDLAELIRKVEGRRLWLFTKRAKQLYTDVAYRQDDVLVFGKETKGLPESLVEAHRNSTLLIPIRPAVRSLNLANAVAIGLYEAQRQLDFDGVSG
jgi:tRNA (cytidine/uridine-2'-O-)-methyltransferase